MFNINFYLQKLLKEDTKLRNLISDGDVQAIYEYVCDYVDDNPDLPYEIVSDLTNMFIRGLKMSPKMILSKVGPTIPDFCFFGLNCVGVEVPSNIKTISNSAFREFICNTVDLSDCSGIYLSDAAFMACEIQHLYLPNVTQFTRLNCDAVQVCRFTNIYYNGTKQEWEDYMSKVFSIGDEFTGNYIKVIHCNDGDIKL
jgi:hypothetical protein